MTSERLQRFQNTLKCGTTVDALLEAIEKDKIFVRRILDLLNNADVDETWVVDAVYHMYTYDDLSEETSEVLYRNSYLLEGKTKCGDYISKWVKKYDLDSDAPIKNGVVENEGSILKNNEGSPDVKISINRLEEDVYKLKGDVSRLEDWIRSVAIKNGSYDHKLSLIEEKIDLLRPRVPNSRGSTSVRSEY